jgi:putative flippase GtrA
MADEPKFRGEASIFAKATLSSLAATVVDGIAYQLVLLPLPGRYGVAALTGAVLGAITNFTINRLWAFPPTSKKLYFQASQYAVVSGLVYLGLQASLWLLIEVLGLNERIAWLPAKIFSWMVVSYPLQRFLVFRERKARPTEA